MTFNVRVHSQTGYATVAPGNTGLDAKLELTGSPVALAMRGASSQVPSTASPARRPPSSKPPSPRNDLVLIGAANPGSQPQREPDRR